MSKSRGIGICPSHQETIGGIVYLACQIFLLPGLLTWGNGQLALSLNEAELNFVFFIVNFIAILLIFHDFLGSSLNHALHHPAQLCQAVILGFVAYYACIHGVNRLIGLLAPGFSNYNDASIAALSRGSFFLMFIGTVILVPPVEECLYRGLIFRNLYGKSPLAAYIFTILAFAVIHIIGYVGQYSVLELTMAFLQYLPAGLCLAWSYVKGNTIFVPIIIHAAINYITLTAMR